MVQTMLMKLMVILLILYQHYVMNFAPLGLYNQKNPK